VSCGLFVSFFFQNSSIHVFGIQRLRAMSASAWQAKSGQRLIKEMMGIGCLQGIRNVQQQARTPGHVRLILFSRVAF
jgi:hypothetical protein